MVNLNQIFNSKITLSQALLLFYLAIGNNFLKDLYPGQLVDAVDKSRFAQHLIGFITMFVLISLAGNSTKVGMTLIYSALAYMWFVLTTKLDLHWNLAILLLLFVGYIYETSLEDKEVNSQQDKALNEEDKQKITVKHNKIKLTILVTILIITGLGTFFYYNKKQTQYGGKFDSLKFIFGPRNKVT